MFFNFPSVVLCGLCMLYFFTYNFLRILYPKAKIVNRLPKHPMTEIIIIHIPKIILKLSSYGKQFCSSWPSLSKILFRQDLLLFHFVSKLQDWFNKMASSISFYMWLSFGLLFLIKCIGRKVCIYTMDPLPWTNLLGIMLFQGLGLW